MDKKLPFVLLRERVRQLQNIQKNSFLFVLLMFFCSPISIFSQSQIFSDNEGAISVIGDAYIVDYSTNDSATSKDWKRIKKEKSGKKNSFKIKNKKFSEIGKNKKNDLFAKQKKSQQQKTKHLDSQKQQVKICFNPRQLPNSSFGTTNNVGKAAIFSNKFSKKQLYAKRFSERLKKKIEVVYLHENNNYLVYFSSYNFSHKFSVRPPPAA